MKVQTRELAPGVTLYAIQTDKFKSAMLSASFLAPLSWERAAVNALVPRVLRRGTEGAPTMAEVSAELDGLYGAALEGVVRKAGTTQCLGLVGSVLHDSYALEGEPLLERFVDLLTRMLLRPVTEGGVFKPDYVEGEKRNLIQAIRAEVNDKRQYAMTRLVREMYRGEPFGVDRLGREEDVSAATPETVWEAYRDLLAHAPLVLFYCGRASDREVEGALAPLVREVKSRRGELWPVECRPDRRPEGPPRQVTDRMEVTQGKLALGFRTGGVTRLDADYPAMEVFGTLYGGCATSKLFMNVRERLSLCYYASATLESVQGLLAVSSGVEFHKLEEAQREILAQLEAVKAKDFTEEELESARRNIIDSCRSSEDNRGALEAACVMAAVTGKWTDPEEHAERVSRVTAEDVARMARRLELDTVYHLLGKEGKDHGGAEL